MGCADVQSTGPTLADAARFNPSTSAPAAGSRLQPARSSAELERERLFGKAWREEWVVLYDDSTLAWFKEKGRGQPEGSVRVKDAPEMMAVSQWTARIPGRPDLPSGCHVVQLMAFGTRRRDKVHWLLAQSEQEVNDWMTAISNTLPPPPQPPDEKCTSTPKLLDPMAPRLPHGPYYSMPGEVPPPYAHQQHSALLSSGAFTAPVPANGYLPVPAPASNTTIVVRDRDHYVGGNGGADFATGLMMGAALTNWGHGWGWHHGASDVHVHNHYDVNNTVINNEHHSATYVHEDYADLGFDDGDYGMDCGGDFGF
ncbi:uncharacterized protein LOC124795802 [Schistocerca piceifrons]|uniref:uncharacterized protein LOC124795802 n=1 Tax=Schistocerca piceifrons TaxID=274613 RepID=UPI001F5E929B|nr:uncharacterized protein LOC124795802 [Schistocerca piceifrons]